MALRLVGAALALGALTATVAERLSLWRVHGETGIEVLGAVGDQTAVGYAPIGAILVGTTANDSSLLKIIFPYDGFVNLDGKSIVPIRAEASCPSSPSGAVPLMHHNFSQSPYHISSLANSGHWTEQAPLGSGLLGAFVGGTLRHAVVPLSIADNFLYNSHQLKLESKPAEATLSYKQARDSFTSTGQFQDRALKQRDGTGVFIGLADLALVFSDTPFTDKAPIAPSPQAPGPRGGRPHGGGGGGRWSVLESAKRTFAPSSATWDTATSVWGSTHLDMAAGIAHEHHVMSRPGCHTEVHHREWFISRAHHVLVGRLQCAKLSDQLTGDCLNVALQLERGLDSPKNAAHFKTKVKALDAKYGNGMSIEMRIRSTDNVIVPEAVVCAAVICADGTARAGDAGASCSRTREATVVLGVAKQSSLGKSVRDLVAEATATSADELHAQCWTRVHKAMQELPQLRRDHVRTHNSTMTALAVDLRASARDGGPLESAAVTPALLQSGRYLLLSSSGGPEGVANLQGVWCDGLSSAWNGDYHMNINMQMIYWPAHSGALGDDVFAPVVSLLHTMAHTARAAAQGIFGSSTSVSVDLDKGSVHFTSALGKNSSSIVHFSNPAWLGNGFTDSRLVGELLGGTQWGFCVTCGAWVATHLLDHLEHRALNTYDSDTKALLLKVRLVLRGVAAFFLEHMFPTHHTDPRTKRKYEVLHTGPTTSPENSFRVGGSLNKVLHITLTPAIDISVLREAAVAYAYVMNYLAGKETDVESAIDTIMAKRFLEAVRLLPNRGVPRVHGGKKQVMEYPDPWTLRFSNRPAAEAVDPVDSRILRAASDAKERLPQDTRLDEVVDETVDAGHRHFSGVHWLYPGTLHHPVLGSALDDPTVAYSNSELFAAAHAFMMHKKRAGGGHTSWSASWEACLWARLGQAELAHEALQRIARRYTTSNLLSLHPPLQDMHVRGCITCYKERPFDNNMGLRRQAVQQMDRGAAQGLLSRKREFETGDNAKFQLDGNSGFVAAALEMLLQTHTPNALSVLPALPKAWARGGHINGVRGRGHISCDVAWSAGGLTSLHVRFLSLPHPHWTQSSYHRSRVVALTSQSADWLAAGTAFPLAVWAPTALVVAADSTCAAEALPLKAPASWGAAHLALTVLRVQAAGTCSLHLVARTVL